MTTAITAANMVLIVVMGLLLFWMDMSRYAQNRNIGTLLSALIGLVWAVFYVIILLFTGLDKELTRFACVRPLITITLAVLTSGAIIRYRSQ